MSALYDSGFYYESDLFIKERPLPEGTLVRYKDLDDIECLDE